MANTEVSPLLKTYPQQHNWLRTIIAIVISLIIVGFQCIMQLLILPRISEGTQAGLATGISIGSSFCLRVLNDYTWKQIQLDIGDYAHLGLIGVHLDDQERDALRKSDNAAVILRICLTELPVFMASLTQACRKVVGPLLAIALSFTALGSNILFRRLFQQGKAMREEWAATLDRNTAFNRSKDMESAEYAKYAESAVRLRETTLRRGLIELARSCGWTVFILVSCCYMGSDLPSPVLFGIVKDVITCDNNISKTWKSWVPARILDSQEPASSISNGDGPDGPRVLLFLDCIKNYGSLERAPRGLPGAWEALRKADPHSTPRIFLDAGGTCAWFIYFTTKARAGGTKHFRGKKKYKRLLEDLEGEPLDSRKALAQKLGRQASNDIKMKISELLNKLREPPGQGTPGRSNKRQRIAADNVDTRPTSNLSVASNEVGIHSPKRGHPAGIHPHALQYIPGHTHALVSGSLDGTTSVFPQEFAGWVVRHPSGGDYTAGIWMHFPNVLPQGKAGCLMAVEITYEKAPCLVQRLFGFNIEIKGERRYVSFPNGSSIEPGPIFMIPKGELDIESTVGSEVTRAVYSSPEYEEDKKQRSTRTRSIRVIVSGKSSEPIIFYMSMGLWQGTQIAQRIFPQR
ncbi:hypothetical protein F5Y10DRAFT_290545 [Nemania abortiva]|nr:hypothetical protein F5Y10DRAFT_290545 [Nemania abortiva]